MKNCYQCGKYIPSGFGEAELPDGMGYEHRCTNRQDAAQINSRSQADTTKDDGGGRRLPNPFLAALLPGI